MNSDAVVKYAAVLLGVLTMLTAAYAGEEIYFADDSLRGTLSPNNPPSQAQFHSGRYNRTYVTYRSTDGYSAKVTYYDHDTRQWAEPVAVDDCRYDDGHNNPEILVTRDGYLHLFYGCHVDPIKYARSLYPEDITRWRLGKEIGARSTYPHPVEVGNGDILVFARRSLGGGHGVTFVYRSTDNGSTWDEGTQLVSFRAYPDEEYLTAAYQRAFIYDATEDLVYCALTNSGSHMKGGTYAEGRTLTPYTVKYNPTTRHLIAMNGVDLGTTTNRLALDANDCQRSQYLLQVGARVLTIDRSPGEEGPRPGNQGLYTPDGVNVVGFTTLAGELLQWHSSDGGQSWDDGRVVLPPAALDGDQLGPYAAVVRDYPGNGPMVILQGAAENASPEFEYRYKWRRIYQIKPIRLLWRRRAWSGGWNQYNNPSRRAKLLYALDGDGRFVTREWEGTAHGLDRAKDDKWREPPAPVLSVSGLGDRERIGELIAKMKAHVVWIDRDQAMWELIQIGTPAVPALIATLSDEIPENLQSPHVARELAATGLGYIGDPRAVGPLVRLASDTDLSSVLVQATRALRKLTGEDFHNSPEQWQAWWEENKHRLPGAIEAE